MVGTSIHNEKLSCSIFHGVTVGLSEPVTAANPPLLFVSSGAQWVAGDGPLAEFNVTSQKTDDAVFGLEVD